MIIYQTDDGLTKIDVKLQNETVWLNQEQLVELYDSSKSNISEHIKNIFFEGELEEKSVVRKIRTTAKDGKSYNVKYYNLDMIISLGYRIKSKVATNFRIWEENLDIIHEERIEIESMLRSRIKYTIMKLQIN